MRTEFIISGSWYRLQECIICKTLMRLGVWTYDYPMVKNLAHYDCLSIADKAYALDKTLSR